jgi:hypothetical protein
MAISCNVSKSDVEVRDNAVTFCNGTATTATRLESVTVVGHSSDFAVAIRGSALSVLLSAVAVDAPAPLLVEGSSVELILEGSNSLRGSAFHAAAECSGANLTIKSSGDGELFADGGGEGPGVGIGGGGPCVSLFFVNATVTGIGMTGLGTGGSNAFKD